MRYKVKLEDIEECFNNAWSVACSEIPEHGIGKDIEEYFWKKYKILLINSNLDRIPRTKKYNFGWIQPKYFGWTHLVFKSRASYVLFILEWSS